MAKYRVTDKDGNEVKEGDTVTDFRGDTAIFEYVTRGAMPGKSAKVLANGRELYSTVYDLTVETIED